MTKNNPTGPDRLATGLDDYQKEEPCLAYD